MSFGPLFLLLGMLFLSNMFTIEAVQAEENFVWGEMLDQICEDNSCSVNKTDQFQMSSFVYVLSPLKQISQGIDVSNITCNEGKVLVLKQSNGLPACVNSSSVEKLIIRGWAIHILPDYVNGNNNSEIFALGTHKTMSETVT
ncbi:MAG: dienelactone hydrolase family protein, partial [Nitrosopumilus sp.]